MRKTTFPAFISTAILCYIFWLLITGQIVSIFQGAASAEVLIAGAVVSILVALFSARFLIHKKAFHLYNPARFFIMIYYCVVVFGWELIKANVNMAIKAFCPLKKIKPGIVKVPVDLSEDYALSMLANSITLTPGTITMETVEEKGQNYFYIHWIDVETTKPRAAGDAIKGTMEKWIRRIWQ